MNACTMSRLKKEHHVVNAFGRGGLREGLTHFLFCCSACWNCCAKALVVIKRASNQSSNEPGGGRKQGEDNHNDKWGGGFRDGGLAQRSVMQTHGDREPSSPRCISEVTDSISRTAW